MTSTYLDHKRSPIAESVVWIVLVNLPFAIGHPVWTLGEWPLVRSLAINLVLFWAPGWVCLAPSAVSRESRVLVPVGVILVSFTVFLGILGGFQLLGRPVDAAAVWNTTWLLTNVMLACRLLVFRKPFAPVPTTDKPLLAAVALFAASYPLYFWGATRVVPPQLDHDFEVQGTGPALLERLEPLLLTDRGTHYYFAHPPMLHFYVAASFLYFGETEHLEVYDAASQRVRSAKRGEAFVPLQGRFDEYDVVGRLEGDYLVRSTDGTVVRVPVERVELELIEEHYLRDPHRLETRTPTIFLAAVTVAVLGWWATRLTGSAGWGLLAGAAYATSPEVFVRSSYGGYFGISNFAVLALLWTASSWSHQHRRQDFFACGLAGFFAAVANHKLILLPAALAAFEFGRRIVSRRRVPVSVVGHPALAGFLVGTALFWLYGLLISPAEFWTEHVRTHLIDRVAHINPLGYEGYPTPVGLWREFLVHTGFILLPVACVALLDSTIRGTAAGVSGAVERVSTTTMRAWLVWILVTAAVFTMVDWRMTKHLMVLMIPLFLVPVVWAQRGRAYGWVVAVCWSIALGGNLIVLQQLAADFSSFQISPGW